MCYERIDYKIFKLKKQFQIVAGMSIRRLTDRLSTRRRGVGEWVNCDNPLSPFNKGGSISNMLDVF
jgi:hypothetical protein